MRSGMRNLLVAAHAFGATVSLACYPVAAHPTRVDPGLALTMGMSGQLVFDSNDGGERAPEPAT